MITIDNWFPYNFLLLYCGLKWDQILPKHLSR